MYVVLSIHFNPELHSVWGPFESVQAAEKWIEKESDEEELTIEELVNPFERTLQAFANMEPPYQ